MTVDTGPELNALRDELLGSEPHTTTMNLVVWNDAVENRSWVVERASAIGEKHPSRTIVLDATQAFGSTSAAASVAVGEQSARIDVGVAGLTHGQIRHIVRTLIAPEVPSVLWWTSAEIGSTTPFALLLEVAASAVLDSSGGDGDAVPIRTLADFCTAHPVAATVRDLAWQRIHPWQDMVARFFDDPHLREELFCIRSLQIVSGSDAEALYLGGWLASRLGWTASAHDEFADRNGHRIAFEHVRAGRPRRVRSVALETETSVYKCERSEADDLMVKVWAEGKHAQEPSLYGLQWVDGASLVERAIIENSSDEIFETALRMVRTLIA